MWQEEGRVWFHVFFEKPRRVTNVFCYKCSKNALPKDLQSKSGTLQAGVQHMKKNLSSEWFAAIEVASSIWSIPTYEWYMLCIHIWFIIWLDFYIYIRTQFICSYLCKFLSKSKQPLFVKLDILTPYAEATEGVSLGQCAQWHCGFSPSGGGAVSRGHHQTQGTDTGGWVEDEDFSRVKPTK